MLCKPPANLIRHAYSRYEYVCANILVLTYSFRHTIGPRQSGSNEKLVSSYWLKFATLRLFVKTMPIYKAVATPNGKNEFYRERHVQIANNPQSALCQTEAKLLCPSRPPSFFIFHYHLPLRRPIAIFDLKKKNFSAVFFQFWIRIPNTATCISWCAIRDRC